MFVVSSGLMSNPPVSVFFCLHVFHAKCIEINPVGTSSTYTREPRPASIFSLAFLERVRRVLDQLAIRSTLICSSNATNSILVVVVVNRVQTVILFRPRLFIHSDFFLSPLSLLEKLIL